MPGQEQEPIEKNFGPETPEEQAARFRRTNDEQSQFRAERQFRNPTVEKDADRRMGMIEPGSQPTPDKPAS